MRVSFSTYRPLTPIYYACYKQDDFVLFVTRAGICGFHFLAHPLSYYLSLATQKFGITPIHSPQDVATWKTLLNSKVNIPLVLHGTDFQINVWRLLTEVPLGSTVSYGVLAERLGLNGAARAVGNAVGSNFIAGLIPCHRVIKSNGQLGGYRWGIARKQAMLEEEQSI